MAEVELGHDTGLLKELTLTRARGDEQSGIHALITGDHMPTFSRLKGEQLEEQLLPHVTVPRLLALYRGVFCVYKLDNSPADSSSVSPTLKSTNVPTPHSNLNNTYSPIQSFSSVPMLLASSSHVRSALEAGCHYQPAYQAPPLSFTGRCQCTQASKA